MNKRTITSTRAMIFLMMCSVAVGIAAPGALAAAPQEKAAPAAATKPIQARRFATPQLAADALIKAAETYDVTELVAILGSDGRDIVVTGEPARDKEMASQFVEKAKAKTNVAVTGSSASLTVGEDDWPFPAPIVRAAGKWYFDSKAGLRELLVRRIGRNELDAIAVCRGYVEAQNEYALTKHDGATVNQYAQRIISSPGKQDGLLWKNADGTFGGPISEETAKAVQLGYTRRDPYHGYYFKILKGQGPSAPLGTLDYVVDGAMIGGFALIAAPANYRVTGVKTFMVSNDGVVWEKDLGPDTLEIARRMERFDPDKTWSPVLTDDGDE